MSLRAFRGRVVVLTFMYTTCRDTCPLTATQIRGALDDLEPRRRRRSRSPSTRSTTRPSARASSSSSAAWPTTGCGSCSATRRAARSRSGRPTAIRPQGKAFDHSAYVLLIDRHGRQRIGFPVQQLAPEGLAHDIRRLQAEP